MMMCDLFSSNFYKDDKSNLFKDTFSKFMMQIIYKIVFHLIPGFLYFRSFNKVKQQKFCCWWIKRHLKWAYHPVDFTDDVYNKDVVENQSIFVYWKQGLSNAPLIVQRCIDSLKRNANGHPIVLIDENNIGNYVCFPEFIEEKHRNGIIKEALFSDLLRLSLLIKYGGCWVDATCYLSCPIPSYVFKSKFFMFSKPYLEGWESPIEGSSWFISSYNNGGVKWF